MNPYISSLVPFCFALGIMVVFAARGVSWGTKREEARLSRIQNIGLNQELRNTLVYPVFLAVLTIYLSSQLHFSWFWNALGYFLISLFALVFLVSVFASWPKPTAEQTKEILRNNKRIRNKKIGGAVYGLLAGLWLYSGYGKVI